MRRKTGFVAVVLLLALTAFFYAFITTRPPTELQPTTQTVIRTETATPLPRTETATTPLTFTERPVVWFNPMPRNFGVGGSLDFMDLFEEDAPWPNAAKRVHVFELYGGWVSDFPWHNFATDAELRQVVADLNRRGIAIAFGASPLVPTETCGRGVEGFFGPEEGLRIARRIKEAGGIVRFVALDEPFAFGSLYSGPNACRWPAERVAQEVATYVAAIKSIFPDIIVGEDEPLWKDVDTEEYKNWLNVYRAVTGSNLAFFHLDLDFSRPDWPEAARELESFARDRGIEFGIFYMGDADDVSDEEWLAHAEERMVTYEARAGGRPDHIIFASWHDRPDRVLPETDRSTFTHLILRYFRTRTALRLSVGAPAADGSLEANGTLVNAAGRPLASASVELAATPIDGPGLFSEYILAGIVPAGSTQADVGFRVNTECGCAGTADFVLYEVRYVEGKETVNRVPNWEFTRGLEGWSFWGNGTVRLERSDRGSGRMLHVTATPTQTAAINSAAFPVNPGATYTLTFAARVSPVSKGSGYFDIVFLAPPEVAREIIPLEPAIVSIGSTVTDESGVFRFTLRPQGPFNVLFQATYPGDDGYWPAFASIVFGSSLSSLGFGFGTIWPSALRSYRAIMPGDCGQHERYFHIVATQEPLA